MKKNGYTLIELLVSLAVVGILVGIGATSYRDFNEKQTVKGVAQNLKNDLRKVQNKVLAGEKDCRTSFCGGTVVGCGNDAAEKTLDAWLISFSANSYLLYGSCAGTQFSQTTVNLPPNVSLTATQSPLQFKVLGQGLVAEGTNCLIGFGRRYKIVVTTSGEIKDEGFVASCP